MQILKTILAAGATAFISLESFAAPTAKVVVLDAGKTFRFVYDEKDYGEKDVDWYSVDEADARLTDVEDVPWYLACDNVTKVVFDATFKDYRPRNCGSWFFEFGALTTIEHLDYLDTSETLFMSFMFDYCLSLKSLDVTHFDTSNVRKMAWMFADCAALTELDLSSFDTQNVSDMYEMFRRCTSLKRIYASDKFVVNPSVDDRGMFAACTAPLIGGKGTKWQDKNPTDATYAHLDGGATNPGYFTERRKYTICFNKYDGTETMFSQQFLCGETEKLPKISDLEWSRTGLTFKGWATSELNAAAGKVWKTDGASVRDAVGVGKVLEVFAVWELKADYYGIRFNMNDGSEEWRTGAYKYDVKTKLPSCADDIGWTRTGFVFKGWSLSPAGAIWKRDGGVVKTGIPKGTVQDVYAIWTLADNAYAIQYVRNDGAGAVRMEGFVCNQSSNLATIEYLGWARRGYEFMGWATSAAKARAGEVWKVDGAKVKNAIGKGKRLTIYAIWKLKEGFYEIKFNKNDGTGKWRALGYEYGKTTVLPTCENGLGWSFSDYTFKGWATSVSRATAGIVWKTDGASVKNATTAGKTLNVHASWVK